ncbi:hypothetical protein ACIGKQ_24740 [Gordonia sp. NPDC062954]
MFSSRAFDCAPGLRMALAKDSILIDVQVALYAAVNSVVAQH